MKWAVCVPSKGRPNLETYDKFLSLMNKDNVYIFVEPQDYDLYKFWEGKINIVQLPENNQGIGYARSRILCYMKNHEFDVVIMCDDNIKHFEQRGEFLTAKNYYKLVPVENHALMFENIAKICHTQYSQLGISFSPSNWTYVDYFKENCRIWAVFAINLNAIDDINFDEKVGIGEDFDFTIRLIQAGKRVAVWYGYCFDKVMAENKGGGNKHLYDNVERTKEQSQYLVNKHGTGICELTFNDKHKIYEVDVHWSNVKPKLKHDYW